MAKMGGPWRPLPKEVVDLLDKESNACLVAYVRLITYFRVEHDTSAEGEWVGGRVHAGKWQIGERVCPASRYFYRHIWPVWVKAGVAEMRDGGIYLTKLYKKGDSYYQPLRLRQDMDELREVFGTMKLEQGEMQTAIGDLLRLLGRSQTVVESTEREEEPGEAVAEQEPQTPLEKLRSDNTRIAAKEIDIMVTAFYKSLGITRIAGPVRTKGNRTIRALLAEGYKPGEIEYAILWTIENATEPVKHIGILPHTIDQAIEAGQKEVEIVQVRAARESAEDQVKRERKAEQEQREAFADYKAALPKEDRDGLRAEAMERLENTPGIKTNMIVEALVSAMENEILRKSGKMPEASAGTETGS